MSRTRLPDRRPSYTVKVDHKLGNENVIHMLVTVGRDPDGLPREVFCADFKAGSDMHAAVTDACILLSRLLQMGVKPDDISTSLGHPLSLIGTLAQAVCGEQSVE